MSWPAGWTSSPPIARGLIAKTSCRNYSLGDAWRTGSAPRSVLSKSVKFEPGLPPRATYDGKGAAYRERAIQEILLRKYREAEAAAMQPSRAVVQPSRALSGQGDFTRRSFAHM